MCDEKFVTKTNLNLPHGPSHLNLHFNANIVRIFLILLMQETVQDSMFP